MPLRHLLVLTVFLTHACWSHGETDSARRLHRVYEAVARGDLVPPLFNQVWLVLIPKAPLAQDTAHVASCRAATADVEQQLPDILGQGIVRAARDDRVYGRPQRSAGGCSGTPDNVQHHRRRHSDRNLCTTLALTPVLSCWTF